MIGALTGKIFQIFTGRIILDVQGVGYEVFLSTESLSRIPEKGGEISLLIHTQVREDAITLYGFLDEEEKEMFLLLRSVSGIGPKLALGVLSGIQVGELGRAIIEKNVKRLTSISGIGKKSAERICVELKDKVGELTGGASGVSAAGLAPVAGGSNVSDALSALVNLGYPDQVARQALAAVEKRVGSGQFEVLDVEELIRETLRSLA